MASGARILDARGRFSGAAEPLMRVLVVKSYWAVEAGRSRGPDPGCDPDMNNL